jgi:hypothetical protein
MLGQLLSCSKQHRKSHQLEIHPVFHVSQLKSCHAELEIQPEFDGQPDSVLDQSSITKDGTLINQSLIKWKGSSVENIT